MIIFLKETGTRKGFMHQAQAKPSHKWSMVWLLIKQSKKGPKKSQQMLQFFSLWSSCSLWLGLLIKILNLRIILKKKGWKLKEEKKGRGEIFWGKHTFCSCYSSYPHVLCYPFPLFLLIILKLIFSSSELNWSTCHSGDVVMMGLKVINATFLFCTFKNWTPYYYFSSGFIFDNNFQDFFFAL